MTQETYDAWYAQKCPECPYNHCDGSYNRCSQVGITHQIFKRKPRWCPYFVKDEECENASKES